MNLKTMRDQVKARVAPITFHAEAILSSPKMIDAFINEGNHIIEQRTRWKFSERVGTGTTVGGSINLPGADVVSVSSVYDLTQNKLLSYADLRQVELDMTKTGEPDIYLEWAGSFYVWPNPGDGRELRIRYYFSWPELVEDTDEPVMPESFHPLLIDFANAQLAYRNRRSESDFAPTATADMFMKRFEAGIERMMQSWMTDKTSDVLPNHLLEQDLLEEEMGWW